jgi:hypothetical protein
MVPPRSPSVMDFDLSPSYLWSEVAGELVDPPSPGGVRAIMGHYFGLSLSLLAQKLPHASLRMGVWNAKVSREILIKKRPTCDPLD